MRAGFSPVKTGVMATAPMSSADFLTRFCSQRVNVCKELWANYAMSDPGTAENMQNTLH